MNKSNGYDMNKIPTHCRRFHAASFQLILLALQSASVRAVLRVGPVQKSFQEAKRDLERRKQQTRVVVNMKFVNLNF